MLDEEKEPGKFGLVLATAHELEGIAYDVPGCWLWWSRRCDWGVLPHCGCLWDGEGRGCVRRAWSEEEGRFGCSAAGFFSR
jgi:hypothetical protein